jgi:hypothetical protein
VVTALFFLALSLAANFLNALLIRSSPGFGNVSLPDLALLWCSRPRLAWFAALLVFVGKERGEYFSAGASALISEIVLQSIGAVYLARTVRFAALRSFYPVGQGEAIVAGWRAAQLMYAGALLWTAAVGAVLFQIVYSFLGLHELLHRAMGKAREKQHAGLQRGRDRVASSVRRRVAERVLPWATVSRKVLMARADFVHRLRPAEE